MDIFGFHSQEPWGKFKGFQNTNELYNPVTMGICPEKSFDYAGLYNKETVDAEIHRFSTRLRSSSIIKIYYFLFKSIWLRFLYEVIFLFQKIEVLFLLKIEIVFHFLKY